jgi:hypothetical protein
MRGEMTEDFIKWLCEKVGIRPGRKWVCSMNNYEYLGLLTKAMWAINMERAERKRKSWIEDNSYFQNVTNGFTVQGGGAFRTRNFFLQDYNNSEQKALETALKYIYEQEKRNEM